MKFQLTHYGIQIPASQQPTCKTCGGGMSLNIAYPNDECIAFWYCLDDNCDAEFEQLSFTDWLAQYPVSDAIRKHFASVGIPFSELKEWELRAAGYTKVGGHIWGGGFWGEATGEKHWTGYKGQCMEYWLPPTEIDEPGRDEPGN